MKKLLVASAFAVAFGGGSGLAADAPYAPSAPAYAAWNWSGFYFGGHTGQGFSRTDWQSPSGFFSPTFFEGKSVLGGTISGAQLGYNWQSGAWVYGAELSGSWADIHGFARCVGVGGAYICNTKLDAFGSATGRLGYAIDHLLLYGKAGIAVAHDKENMTSPFFVNNFNGHATRTGWTAGAGVEYAFTPGWSAFAEFDWADFGTKSVHVSDQFGQSDGIHTRQNLGVVKLGLNYRLGADPASFPPAQRYVKAPIMSEWTMEAGTRYWFNGGKMVKDLRGIPATLDNSRLTYGPDEGHALEAFARFDHSSGIFVKGFLGFGVSSGGHLIDEDFPPVTVPYSRTTSDMKQGRLQYGALDVGMDALKGPGWKVGPFVGYRYYYQVANGFGCTQTATNPAICVPPDTGALGLTETENWRGVAVGLNGEMKLADRLKLIVDAAYLPYVNFSGVDNHWFRANINPQVEVGHGWGTQIEAILNYALTDRWSVGVGGRYWYFRTTKAHTEFVGFAPQEQTFDTQRYGVFVQTSYKFDGSDLRDPVAAGGVFKAPARVAAVNWSGIYAGAHAGGGWGVSDWKSADGVFAGATSFPGTSDINGLLAGGQLGFRSQSGNWVWGASADASWSNIIGTAKCATFAGPNSGTCQTLVDAFGTITAELGKTTGKFLFYGKAGVGWADEKDRITSATVGPFASTGSQTRWGWTAGSGIAYALTPNWSVFAEYDYLGLGSKAVTLTDPTFGTSHVRIDQHINAVKLGANYKFDWSDGWGKAPVMAKY